MRDFSIAILLSIVAFLGFCYVQAIKDRSVISAHIQKSHIPMLETDKRILEKVLNANKAILENRDMIISILKRLKDIEFSAPAIPFQGYESTITSYTTGIIGVDITGGE